MSKGVSGIIIVMIILLVSVSLTAGFYFWVNSSTSDIKDTAESKVDSAISNRNSGIAIVDISKNDTSSTTEIKVRNTGKTTLDTNQFTVFINGAIIESSNDIESIIPGDVLTITSEHELMALDGIRVIGQHNTIDQCLYQDDGSCTGDITSSSSGDVTPPTVTATHNPNSVYEGESVTVLVQGTDSGSSVTNTEVWIDGMLRNSCQSNSCSWSDGYQSGTHSYYGKATSSGGTGHSTTNSFEILPDSLAPITTIDTPSWWRGADFNVKLTDNDNESGLSLCEYRILNNGIMSKDWGPRTCSGTITIDISSYCTTNGHNKCRVEGRATDNSNNVGLTVSREWGIDTIDPTATVTHSPASPIYGNLVTFTGSGTDSHSGIASVSVYVDGSNRKTCTSSQCSWNTTSLSIGSHQYFSVTVDNTGNTNQSSTKTMTVSCSSSNQCSSGYYCSSGSCIKDTTLPSVSITHSPASPIFGQTITFTLTASDSESSVTRSEIWVDSSEQKVCSTGSCSWQVSSLSVGTHSYYGKATSAAGIGQSTTKSVTVSCSSNIHCASGYYCSSGSCLIDNNSPNTIINSGPSGTTTSTSATFTFSCNDSEGSVPCQFRYRLDRESWDLYNWTSWSTGTSANFPNLSAGLHKFEVQSRDNAGNINSASASRTWRVDTGLKYIFVTANNYSDNFGGLSGADSKCQSAASTAGLPGTYRALLSTSTVNAKDRISNCNLYNVNGVQMTSSCSDLWDGSIPNIMLTEYGSSIANHEAVATGSFCDGNKRPGKMCGDWDGSYDGSDRKGLGWPYQGGCNWINESGNNYSCGFTSRLYCFRI